MQSMKMRSINCYRCLTLRSLFVCVFVVLLVSTAKMDESIEMEMPFEKADSWAQGTLC